MSRTSAKSVRLSIVTLPQASAEKPSFFRITKNHEYALLETFLSQYAFCDGLSVFPVRQHV